MSSLATAPRALIISEAAFLKQTDNIQKCLDTFNGIVAVPNLGYAIIKPIVTNLIDATVCLFKTYLLFFIQLILLSHFIGRAQPLSYIRSPPSLQETSW